MPSPVDWIVTHPRPHLDEIAAIKALRDCGESEFPGIKQAKVVPYDVARHEDDRSEDDWLRDDRTVFVGRRGGRWDDHPHTKFPKDCTYTLVLRSLGMASHFRYRRLAREVFQEDRHASKELLYLARTIKQLYHADASFEEVYNHACFALWAHERGAEQLEEAKIYLAEHREHFRTVQNTVGGRNIALWLCALHLRKYSNPHLHEAAKAGRKGLPGADIFVQVHDDGHVQIFGNRSQGFKNLGPLAEALRRKQLEVTGKTLPEGVDWQCEGTMPEVPHFFYQANAASIFNASLTAEDVPATDIPMTTVVALVGDFLREFAGPISRMNVKTKFMEVVTK